MVDSPMVTESPKSPENPGPHPLRVVGYVRVSTDEQSRDGVSLDAQEAKVRGYAALHGLGLVEVVVEAGVSAKTLGRPGLRRALDLLDDGAADGIVIAKLDRLTRSVIDWNVLIEGYFCERGGKVLMSVNDTIDTRTAAGRMLLNLLVTIAQWERETVVERTQAAMDHKRSRGERLGTVPFGAELADDGRTLRESPAEGAAIALMRLWRSEGQSYRSIAATLDAGGVPPRNGGKWHPQSVRSILARVGPGAADG